MTIYTFIILGMSARSRYKKNDTQIVPTAKSTSENKSTSVKRKSALQDDESNRKKRTSSTNAPNKRNRSSSVVSVRSKDSSELLGTELPPQAFSSDNEDDDTENYDNDTASSKSIEDAAQVASTSIPAPITQATDTSNDVQASTTASSINAQETNTSINVQEDYTPAFSDTQAASNTPPLQALQEAADEIKVEKLVRNFINIFVKNPNLWKEFKEVVDSTSYPVNIHKQEQPYNDTQVKASNVS
jgi:hypothetical protein